MRNEIDENRKQVRSYLFYQKPVRMSQERFAIFYRNYWGRLGKIGINLNSLFYAGNNSHIISATSIEILKSNFFIEILDVFVVYR